MARTIKQRIERAQKTRVRQLRARINPAKKLYKMVVNDHHSIMEAKEAFNKMNREGLNAVFLLVYDGQQEEAVKLELIG